jgi:hypothetical protein
MKKWEGGGNVPNDDDGWMKKWVGGGSVHIDDGWMDG